jgi:drug/metabolite transporter (DMT)-like permease
LYCLGLVYAFRRPFRLSYLWTAAPGGLAFGLNISLFFTAVKLTSVTDATIITALQPALLLTVVNRLFGERVTWGVIGGTIVAFGGTALVVLGPGGVERHALVGDVLAVGALLSWAWYFVASKQVRRQMATLEYQAAMTIIAALVVTPVALINGGRLVGEWSTWGWVILLATVPGGGHLLMNWAHAHVRLTITSLLNLATPVLAMAGAALLIHERVTWLQIVGTAIVIGALAAVVINQRQPTPEPVAVDIVSNEHPA